MAEALIRRLRELRRDRRARDTEGVLVAEGLHLAEEALEARADIEHAAMSPRIAQFRGGLELVARLREAGVPVQEFSDARLASVLDARSPQPLALIIRRTSRAVESPRGTMWIVADGLQDPGNFGSLVRSALGAGADGVLAAGSGVDPYHPRSVRATAGAVFRLDVRSVAGVADAVELLGPLGLTWVAADARGAQRYDRCDWIRPFALVLGSEGEGLSPAWDPILAARVAIPLHASVESLSVGVAAAIVMFEAARVRGFPQVNARRDG